MGCPGVGWLDSAPASQDYLSPPPVQAGHTRGLLSSGPQGPASVLLETGRTAAKPGSDVRTRRPLGRAAVCCVHKLSSQHQEGRGSPAVRADCIPAFCGVTTTSETPRQAGVRVRTLPSRSHQCPKGQETAGRPGKTLCSETGPGAMGSVTLASRKALSLPPLGHPIPSDSVEHSGCSGATQWPARPSPYSPPRRLQGCSLGPSPRAGSPREDSQSPPAVHWARLGCHRSGVPEGLSPAVPGVTGAASSWRHLLVAWSGSSPPAGWTQLAVAGLVTRRGPVPPWPTEAERGACGQDGGAASGPRPGAVQCPVHRSRLAGCRRAWGPGLRSVQGRLPRPPGGARGQGGP